MAKSTAILAIETSCDETSAALVRCSGALKAPRFKILKNIVSSQIAVHRPFGGVVPNLAKREHLKNLPIVLRQILKTTNNKRQKTTIDCLAVTVGPGLEPALWTGINFAEELSKKLKKPLIGVNHMEGHLYSNWLPVRITKEPKNKETKKQLPKITFPAIALIVSGGHTILLNMKSITKWTKLGETLDDAAGEAFDKVARMLNLPYPGGPEIQKLAVKGNSNTIQFPRPMLNKKNYEFSFSGLKTSVLYYLRDHPIADLADKKQTSRTNQKKVSVVRLRPRQSADAADVAASFQQAVVDVLVKKTIRAAEEYKAKSILLCGGVSANKALRKMLHASCFMLHKKFVVPDFEFNTDNAAMIAAAAYINLLQKKKKPLPMEADGNLNI